MNSGTRVNASKASRLVTTVIWLALATVVVMGWSAEAAATGSVVGHWTGVALTTTGQTPVSLTLRQDGPQVRGVFHGGTTPQDVEGMLTGNLLVLRLLNSRGHLHLTLSSDGRTITGDGMTTGGARLSSIRLTKL